MNISSRVKNMPVSAVRKLVPYSQKAKLSGTTVYHLNIGDPDIETPEVIIDKLKNWEINPIRYANSKGEPEFINSLVNYYHKLGSKFITADNIIATVGGSEALNITLLTIADSDDEIIVFEPFYSNYSSCTALNNINLVSIETSIDNGFHLPNKDVIINAITSRTKAIMICTPGNPTGTVYSHAELQMLVDIVKEYNIYLISDEVYREYVFDQSKAPSLLEFAEQIPQQAIILDSLSKRYSLCGARLGNIVSLNYEFILYAFRIAQSRLSGGLIEQIIATAIDRVSDQYMQNIINEYKIRRDIVFNKLSIVPGVQVMLPEGAFYLMVKLPVTNSEDFCIWLLENYRDNNETVMLAPGQGFYKTANKGIDEVRIAYVLNSNKLTRALDILEKGLKEYQSQNSI
jgi:aspartate aminotransferase